MSPELRATYTPTYQIAGQLGRVIGPIVYTLAYEIGSVPGNQHGPTNVIAILVVVFALALGVPMALHFRELYGSFSDPPIKEP